MGQVIDLSHNEMLDNASNNIVKIIEAASKAKQSNIELQKQLMLDDISRARNRRDKQLEQQDQINNWGKMMAPDAEQPTGMANSATPNNVGVNPSAPANMDAFSMPQGGYTPQNPPPMSMPNQPTAQPMQQPAQQPMAQPQTAITPTQDTPHSQLTDIGFTPIGVGQLAMARAGKPEAKDFAYIQALSKAKKGMASQGEMKLIKEFNDIKDPEDKKMGSAVLEKRRFDKAEEIINTVESNNVQRDAISQALEATNRIDSGVYGKIKRDTLKTTSPESPIFEDWQKLKMVLTDAQLLYTARTKGAISDKEMELFQHAAANDDITSIKSVMPVLDRMLKKMNATERGMINSYKKAYGEDPNDWVELKKENMPLSGVKEMTKGSDGTGSYSHLWE